MLAMHQKGVLLKPDSVHIVLPSATAISILGEGAIRHVAAKASPNARIHKLSPQEIADEVLHTLAATKDARPTEITRKNRFKERRGEIWSFLGTEFGPSSMLGPSTICDDRLLAYNSLRALAGLTPYTETLTLPILKWSHFATPCKEDLRVDLRTTTNNYIPPQSELVFGEIETFDPAAAGHQYA
jgi:hypothetical protein